MANIKNIDPDQQIGFLSEVLKSQTLLSPEEFLQILPEKVCQILDVPICILWYAKPEQKELQILATAGEIDDGYKQTKLDFQHPGVRQLFKKNQILSLADVNRSNHRFGDLDEIRKRKFVSFMSAPLKCQEKMVGILDVFTKETRYFPKWQQQLLETLANHAVLAYQKIEVLKEVNNDREKLQELIDITHKMTASNKESEIWELLKIGASKLVDSTHIWIGRLNHINGKLEKIEANMASNQVKSIPWEKGIITQALKEENKQIVPDIYHNKLTDNNVRIWPDSKSKIVIVLKDNVLIREKKEVKFGRKIIGILTIENSSLNAFSKTDEERLSLLARHATTRIERLRFYQKIFKIRNIEKKIHQTESSEEIFKTIKKAIKEVLGFDWINISLVNPERTTIKSEYVDGISKDKAKLFKAQAIHSLDSKDIQADIVRSGEIEVPDDDDPRLNKEIFKKFNHKHLIRVFIPIIQPVSNLVIGTVEAGYPRKFRRYIYEQDVQSLKSFVDYAAHAIERKKSGFIDQITHELKSPIVGIKANVSFLQTRFSDIRLSPQLITIKFEDILTDCQLIIYQIRQFEYFLGRSNINKVNLEETVVFRDIIIKTIRQFKFYLKEEYGFSMDRIIYNRNDSQKLIIHTDRTKLNQVVFNLLTNSFKYAEQNDTNAFKVEIELDSEKNKQYFVIKFKDWGIGISEKDKDKIFEEGFRSSQAIINVQGLGLGLTISRKIMRQLGGDLELFNPSQPTEFHLKLPKN